MTHETGVRPFAQYDALERVGICCGSGLGLIFDRADDGDGRREEYVQSISDALVKAFFVATLSVITLTSPVQGQKIAPKQTVVAQQPAAPRNDDAAQPQSGWQSNCTSTARGVAPDCSIEQRLVLSGTGQLLAAVTIRIDGKTRQPALMLQLPHGLYLPEGVSLSVDQAEPISLELQTCDNAGCYAGSPASKKLLDAMSAGAQLEIGFKNLARKDIQVVMPLTGFTAALAKAK